MSARYRQPSPADIPHLAPALFVARELLGYTRARLAAESGVAEARITAFEDGKLLPSAAELHALWRVLASDERTPGVRGNGATP